MILMTCEFATAATTNSNGFQKGHGLSLAEIPICLLSFFVCVEQSCLSFTFLIRFQYPEE
jgi:hypothetical protein